MNAAQTKPMITIEPVSCLEIDGIFIYVRPSPLTVPPERILANRGTKRFRTKSDQTRPFYTIAIPGRAAEPFILEEFAFMAKPESGGGPNDRRRVAAIVREIERLDVGGTYDVNQGEGEAWIVTREA